MSGYTDLSTNFENNRNCLRRIARHNEQEFSKDSIVNVMEKFVKTVNVMDDTILVPCRLMDLQVGDATDITPVPQKSQLHHHHSNNGSHHHHHHHANSGMNRSRKDRNATVHDFLNSADLFNLYTMLNALKNDLLWTRSDDEDDSNSTNNVKVDNNTRQNLTTSVSIAESETSEVSEQQQQQQQQKTSSSSVTNRQTSSSSTTSNVTDTSTTSTVATATTQTIKGHIRRPSTASMASSNSTSNLSDSESEISNENDSGIEYEGHCSGSRTSSSSSGGSSTTSNSKNCTNLDKATELARQCRTHLNGLYRCLEQMTEAANYLTARYQSDIGPV